MSNTYQDGRKWGGILVKDEITLHGKPHAMYTIRHFISRMIHRPSFTERENGLIDGILDSVEGM